MTIIPLSNPPHINVLIFPIIIILIIYQNSWPQTTAYQLLNDNVSITLASTDYGHIVREIPSSVLYPSSASDIISLVRSSNVTSIAARGHGHSVRGQAMSSGGVVVNMRGLGEKSSRIRIRRNSLGFYYADIGAEQLWVDVLRAALRKGLAPVSWTDYLYLTVGGTLSNAGISGQAFLHGPQIANVLQLELSSSPSPSHCLGKGKLVTCSRNKNSELFFGVLGGLGQFGIITRARIILDKAPTKARWARLVYNDFSSFRKDQEYLISSNVSNYVEGFVIVNESTTEQWRPTFSVSPSNQSLIVELLSNQSILYAIELAMYYDNQTAETIDQEFQALVKKLNFVPGLDFGTDATFFDFIHRVGNLDTLEMGSQLSHPWLNLFVPKSNIVEFNTLVLAGMLPRLNRTSGLFIFYPLNKNKWDDRMSAVTPDDDVFYALALLHSTAPDAYQNIDKFNNEILRVCESAGIEVKQYLPHYATQKEWEKHFGSKWGMFKRRKTLYCLQAREFLTIIAIAISLLLSNPFPLTSAWDPLANRFQYDNASLEKASKDYGNIVHLIPTSVFNPTYISDIQILITQKYNNYARETNKSFAIRACGHSTRGQSQVLGGISINVTSLNTTYKMRIKILEDPIYGFYADVGAELQWLDVLWTTLKYNLTPVSWTDYLKESVGGTLSNAGISGQSFKYGPQISNVYSLSVVTGKGEYKSCSPYNNSDLFYGVLGGLGQFGVIISAQIRLQKAPTRAIVTRLLYSNFTEFTNDQEFLISTNLPNYTEGFIIVNDIIPSGWINSNSSANVSDVDGLLKKYTVLYAIEFAMYYDDQTVDTVKQRYQMLIGKLKFIPKFIFPEDVSYFDFLYRVGDLDLAVTGSLLAHPWLVLFTGASQKEKFNKYVLAGLLPNISQAPTIPIYYPLNATKWSNKTSAVLPDEETFYTLGLLHRSAPADYKVFDDFNQKVLSVCREKGIKYKKYLPYYDNKSQWIDHFGSKWKTFLQNKMKFDPKNMLSPSLNIFK
ncbi:cytokinin oxidase/dehydrogenase [Striga asiatica]|uniref:cytokinin dehydrogenase n=1 Tax=Striga asiatica TaxID=4170 RepID=A0A5A7NXE1_STRAF|nr:cytokinin oxidase/dehydrogenase [Striga asiatica]